MVCSASLQYVFFKIPASYLVQFRGKQGSGQLRLSVDDEGSNFCSLGHDVQIKHLMYTMVMMRMVLNEDS